MNSAHIVEPLRYSLTAFSSALFGKRRSGGISATFCSLLNLVYGGQYKHKQFQALHAPLSHYQTTTLKKTNLYMRSTCVPSDKYLLFIFK